jgi:hypothetical protein
MAGLLIASTAGMAPALVLAQVTSVPSSAAARSIPASDPCAAPPVGQGTASQACRQACARDPKASPACALAARPKPAAGAVHAPSASPVAQPPSWSEPGAPAAPMPSAASAPAIVSTVPGSATSAPMPAPLAPAASSTLPPAPPAGPPRAQVPASAPHNALPAQQSADLRGTAASNLDWCKVNDCQPRVFGIDVAQLTTTRPVTLTGEGFGNRKGTVILSSDRGDRPLDIVAWNDTRVVASAASVSGVLDGPVALKVKATSGKESVAVAVPFVAAREVRRVPIFLLHHCDKTTWENVCQPNKADPFVDAWHMDWCGSNRDPLRDFAVCTGWPQGVDVYIVKAPAWFRDYEVRTMPHQCSGACEISYELKANAVAPGTTAVYVRWKGPPKTQVGYKLWAEGSAPRGVGRFP